MGIRASSSEINDLIAKTLAGGGTVGKTSTIAAHDSADSAGRADEQLPLGRYELFIPGWHPASVNKLIGASYYTVKKIKDAAAEMVSIYAIQCGVPQTRTRRRRMQLILSFPNMSRAGDSDNYNKVARDAAVEAKLLVDDSKKWAEFTEPELIDGKPSTLFIFEDIA